MNNALKIFLVCLMLISPIIAGGGGETNKELDPVYEAISHVADSMKITKVGNSYEAGEISALFTLPKIYGIDFSITKHVFLLLLVAFITVTSIIFLVQRYISSHTKVPAKPMNFIEMIVVYIRENVLKNFIGEKYYREWAPLVYTLFFFILVGNFLGLIPIFDFLANALDVKTEELYRTFNMGIGLVFVVDNENKEKIMGLLKNDGCVEVGRVIEDARQKVYLNER